MNNTDEIWWRTLPEMKKKVESEPYEPVFAPKHKQDIHKVHRNYFTLKSGMGNGLYAINSDETKALSF